MTDENSKDENNITIVDSIINSVLETGFPFNSNPLWDNSITFVSQEPQPISFNDQNGNIIFTINPDGTIAVDPNRGVDETAREVLRILRDLSGYTGNNTIDLAEASKSFGQIGRILSL